MILTTFLKPDLEVFCVICMYAGFHETSLCFHQSVGLWRQTPHSFSQSLPLEPQISHFHYNCTSK